MAANDETRKEFLRDELGAYLTELGKKDSRVVVVNADLSKTSRNTEFVRQYPDRAFNVGIAEQNMVSFAAGLAHEGWMPFAYTMAPFMSMRACEQCRTDVAYAKLPVRLIGTYAGVSGGISGATHWGMEDCAIMTTMPDMTVLEPSDVVQGKKMMDALLQLQGPAYMRISVEPTFPIYDEDCDFEIGKASIAYPGGDGAFICSGITVKYAMLAAKNIKERTGKSIRVVDMHTIKPIDRQAVLDAAATGKIVVAQDHLLHGGLASLVSEILAEEGCAVRYCSRGIPDCFETMAHAPFLYHKFLLDAEGLESSMIQLF